MHELIALHVAHLRSESWSPRTIEDAIGALSRMDRDLPMGIEHTFRAELESYFGNPDWSPATRENYWNHAQRFYTWAADRDVDLINENPMVRMRRPKVRKGEPRPLSDEEIAAVLTRTTVPWIRTCFLISLGSGLRCGELAGLKREDIGTERIFIRRAKGGGSASVPSSPEVLEAVRDFPRGSIVEHAGGIADARWISMRSAIYFNRSLGMKGVSLHRCRHTFAKRLRDSGADAFVIKKALRHSSLQSTEIYVGATEDECRLAVQGLAPLTSLAPAAC
jgi:integrase